MGGRQIGEDHIKQRGQVVRCHLMWVASVSHVVHAEINQDEVRRRVRQSVGQGQLRIIAGQRITMRGTGHARGGNHCSVHPFVMHLRETRERRRGPSSEICEGVAIGHKQRLQIRPPCTIVHRVVRDRVATLQHFQRMGGSVIGQYEFRARFSGGQGAHN